MAAASPYPPFSPSPSLEAQADERIACYPQAHTRSAILPLLHIIQHHFGYISPEAAIWTANKLGLSPVQVQEVVSFYPGFREISPGKYHFRICRTLSCAMAGSQELMEKICSLTGIDISSLDGHHHPIAVSPCGTYSVEFAECLASCGSAPVCMVNDDFHENVSVEKAQQLLDAYPQA